MVEEEEEEERSYCSDHSLQLSLYAAQHEKTGEVGGCLSLSSSLVLPLSLPPPSFLFPL